MLPSIDNLRCFAAAARLLNFRAAARAVALTPAALGQRIQQLEAQIGRPLFHRTTRRVTLSDAGLALVPHAQQALMAAEACLRAGRDDADPPTQDLVLGTRHELGMSWVVPMLPLLRGRHPQITFHLYFGSGSDLVLRVRGGEVHCAVGSMRLDDSKLESARLHREDYAFVGQPELLRRTPLRRAIDAPRHTLLDERPAMPLYSYWRDAAGSRLRLHFGRTIHLGTIAAIRAAVLAGEGVAVLPHYLVAPDLAAHRLTEVLPRVRALHDYFRLIFRADDPRRRVYQALAETMAGVALQ